MSKKSSSISDKRKKPVLVRFQSDLGASIRSSTNRSTSISRHSTKAIRVVPVCADDDIEKAITENGKDPNEGNSNSTAVTDKNLSVYNKNSLSYISEETSVVDDNSDKNADAIFEEALHRDHHQHTLQANLHLNDILNELKNTLHRHSSYMETNKGTNEISDLQNAEAQVEPISTKKYWQLIRDDIKKDKLAGP